MKNLIIQILQLNLDHCVNSVIFSGNIRGLKRFKEEVKEVNHGYECGIMIENFTDIKENDIIETYELIETARKL